MIQWTSLKPHPISCHLARKEDVEEQLGLLHACHPRSGPWQEKPMSSYMKPSKVQHGYTHGFHTRRRERSGRPIHPSSTNGLTLCKRGIIMAGTPGSEV